MGFAIKNLYKSESFAEAFFSEINVAFFAATLLIFPIFLAQIWLFLRPGLFANERF